MESRHRPDRFLPEFLREGVALQDHLHSSRMIVGDTGERGALVAKREETICNRDIEILSRDGDDDAILACARIAKADLIVFGDEDLLVLESVAGVLIVTTD